MSDMVRALGLALGQNKPENWGGEPPTACCNRCEEPLIATMKWPFFEFVCICCGKHIGFVDPTPKRADTPGLRERLEELEAAWDEVKDRPTEELDAWLRERVQQS